MTSFIVSEDVRVWIDESYEEHRAKQDRGHALQPAIVDSAGKILSGPHDYDRWATASSTGEILVARSLRDLFTMDTGWYGGVGLIDDLLGGKMVYEFDPGFWELPFRGTNLAGGLGSMDLLEPVAGAVAPAWRPDGRGYALLEGTGAPISKGRIDLWETVDGVRRHHGTLHNFGLPIRGSLEYSCDSRWLLLQGDIQREPALLIDTTTSRFVALTGPDPVAGGPGLLDDLLNSAACGFCWYPPAGPNALLGVVPTSEGSTVAVFDVLAPARSTLLDVRSPTGAPLYFWQPTVDATGSFLVGVAAGLVTDSEGEALGGTPNSVAAVIDLQDGTIDAPLGHRMKAAPAVKIHNHPRWLDPLRAGDSTSLGVLADRAVPLPAEPLDDPDRTRLLYHEYLGTAVFLLSTVAMDDIADRALALMFPLLDAADRTGCDEDPGMAKWIASCGHTFLAERAWRRQDSEAGTRHTERSNELRRAAIADGCELASSTDAGSTFQMTYNDYTAVIVTVTSAEELVGAYLRGATAKRDAISLQPDGLFLTDERGDHRLQVALFQAQDQRIAATFTVLADTDSRIESLRFNVFAELALNPIPEVARNLHAERHGVDMVQTLLDNWVHVSPADLNWAAVQQHSRKKRFGIF